MVRKSFLNFLLLALNILDCLSIDCVSVILIDDCVVEDVVISDDIFIYLTIYFKYLF